MGIVGLSADFVQWFLPRAQRFSEEMAAPQFDCLKRCLESQDTVFPHQELLTALQSLRRMLDPRRDNQNHCEAVERLCGEWRRFLTPERWRIPPIFDRKRPIFVAPGDKNRSYEVVWDEASGKRKWWFLSDELLHACHFWRPGSEGALLALGSFQGYNLVNPHTQGLVRLDLDARQLAQSALFRGLFLLSETPETFIDHFLRLSDPVFYTELLDIVQAHEKSGRIPAGQTQLLWELGLRQGKLTLDLLYDAYVSTMETIRQGKHLSDYDRANFDWLVDPTQYEVVRDRHREWKVFDFQGNVFEPKDMAVVGDFLRSQGMNVSRLYLSDPQDIVDDKPLGQFLLDFQHSLATLPWTPEALVQWTVHESTGNPFLFLEDAGGYRYIEVPVALLQRSLNAVRKGEGGETSLWRMEGVLEERYRIVDGKIIVGEGEPPASRAGYRPPSQTLTERLALLHERRRRSLTKPVS